MEMIQKPLIFSIFGNFFLFSIKSQRELEANIYIIEAHMSLNHRPEPHWDAHGTNSDMYPLRSRKYKQCIYEAVEEVMFFEEREECLLQ